MIVLYFGTSGTNKQVISRLLIDEAPVLPLLYLILQILLEKNRELINNLSLSVHASKLMLACNPVSVILTS